MHPQGYKYTYAKVMHKRLGYMDGLEDIQNWCHSIDIREEEQEVWKWEKRS